MSHLYKVLARRVDGYPVADSPAIGEIDMLGEEIPPTRALPAAAK